MTRITRLIRIVPIAAIIVWSLACGSIHLPPAPGPAPIPVPTPAPIHVDDPTWLVQCSDIWQQELARAVDKDGLAGCLNQLRAGATSEQVRATVRASDEWKAKHPPIPPAPAIRTWADTAQGVCNFGSALDKEGRHIFTPFLARMWLDKRIADAEDWLARLAAENNNCLVLSIEAERGYRDYFLGPFDFRNDLSRFNDFLTWLQTYRAGDGMAWRFIINITSGDGDRQEALSEIAPAAAALRHRNPVVIWCNGFETLREWRAANLSRWFTVMREQFGDTRLMAWGAPNAVAAASYHGDGTAAECAARGYGFLDYADSKRPGLGGCVELDDPWWGGEAESTGSHGSQWITDWAFQWEHGRAVLDDCGRTVFDGTKGKDGQPVAMYPPGCGFNRFDDAVARLGAGLCSDDYGVNGPRTDRCGWPRKFVWAMETDTMDAFQGRSNPAIAERVANGAALIFAAYGVTGHYGSGGPTAWRRGVVR